MQLPLPGQQVSSWPPLLAPPIQRQDTQLDLTSQPRTAGQVRAHVEVVLDALRPWAARQAYLNFAETTRDPHTLWTENAHHRLRRIKANVDPENLIGSNHPGQLTERAHERKH
jgi:hypothetical protein